MSLESNSDTSEQNVTLIAAAEQLGVHYMTAYRYVRTGRMYAEKRGGKWWVAAEDLAAVIAEGTGSRRRSTDPRGGYRDLPVRSFSERLVAGDTAGCWKIIDSELCAGAKPSDIHNHLLRTTLTQIGEEWRRGDLSVADEHRATSTAYRLLGQLGPLFRHRGRRRGTIVIGAVAGDPHALPSAMLADLLCDRHFEVIDLGANTPTDSFVDAARGCDDLVGVGMCVVLDSLVAHAVRQAIEVRAQLPDTYLLVGGLAAMSAAADGFNDVVDTVSLDADHACDAFEEAASAPPTDGLSDA